MEERKSTKLNVPFVPMLESGCVEIEVKNR
jgi:hypothetical protein